MKTGTKPNRKVFKIIRPESELNRLTVEVHELEVEGEFIGVGYTLRTKRDSNGGRHFINIHRREIKELVKMFMEADQVGLSRWNDHHYIDKPGYGKIKK